jgi:hypothetical protein
MEAIREAIYETAKKYEPLTCRQLFYLLVVRGVIEKTDRDYKSTVIRLLGQMRDEHVVPFKWIIDNSRWMRKPDSHASMADALESMRRYYRRDIWLDQEAYVELWTESDSIAGVICDVTEEFDVPLMVGRGYTSSTFAHSAARQIKAIGKPAFLYHVGDHDPSGLDIARHVEERIRKYAPKAAIRFERLAITLEQIELWDLPGRPPKASDSRAKNFEGDSVEAEAIEPELLRAIVRSAIEQHIDQWQLMNTRAIEQAELRSLNQMIENVPGFQDGGRTQ